MLRLLSWNVLADAYVQPAYYPRSDPAVIDDTTPLPSRAMPSDHVPIGVAITG